ncbi:MlaD family protein [Pseudonocardia sp. CA-107938]|uniref:MlaD family protein n=1 Tax=Pseudonocardia sp. CA-107938 TaxID=3240021 RepID=UPI003D8B3812
MTDRGTIVKVVAFFVIGMLAAVLVGAQTLSRDVLGGGIRVAVAMPSAGGLLPNSLVTYRGVKVGTVAGVDVRPDGSAVVATLSLTTDLAIPASTRAVVTQDTPVAISHLDLRPDTVAGPYLQDGATLAHAAELPVPLEQLLAGTVGLLRTVDTDDLHTTTDELAAALQGTGPQLQNLLANAATLADTADQITPKVVDLTEKGNRLLEPTARLVSRLPEFAAALRTLGDGVAGNLDEVSTVVDSGTELADVLTPLLHDDQESLAALLANGAAVGQVLAVRTEALRTGFTTIPDGFRALTRVFIPVPGGAPAIRLAIVPAIGPTCAYPTQRRTPQDVAPRPLDDGGHCAGRDPGLQQRGAANAPSPGGVGSYDPRSGAARTPDGSPASFGINGGQHEVLGARSWASLLLQGVQ